MTSSMTPALRLNLGSGFNQLPGYVNIDHQPANKPDVLWDLEHTPWPFEAGSVSDIHASHVLEHLGRDIAVYLAILQEIYRVCQHGAHIDIRVPHPQHIHYLSDPTHVRPITPEGFLLFDQKLNAQGIAEGWANTPLGLYCNVDFVLVSSTPTFDEPWASRIRHGVAQQHDLEFAARHYTNVITEWHIVLEVRKETADA